jgi:hypothetical protein
MRDTEVVTKNIDRGGLTRRGTFWYMLDADKGVSQTIYLEKVWLYRKNRKCKGPDMENA